jgi:hypothetical protein
MIGVARIARRAGAAIAGVEAFAEAFPRAIWMIFAHPAGVVAHDAGHCANFDEARGFRPGWTVEDDVVWRGTRYCWGWKRN